MGWVKEKCPQMIEGLDSFRSPLPSAHIHRYVCHDDDDQQEMLVIACIWPMYSMENFSTIKI